MSISCYGPVLGSLKELYDGLTDEVKNRSFYPYDVLCEISGKDGKPLKYIIEAALAGIKKSEISVSLTDEGGLKIDVTPERNIEDNIKVIRSNISYSSRSIVFDLIKEIDVKKITSKYENGILRIELPLVDKESKAKKINIA